MCYSGRCVFEDSISGDCIFPTDNIVRNKYKYPVCYTDYYDIDLYNKHIRIIRQLLDRKKKLNFLMNKINNNE